MTVDFRKIEIIKKIQVVEEDWILKSIEKLLSDVFAEGKDSSNIESTKDFSFYVGNIEEKVDLEKIKRERPLKKLNMEKFGEMADSLEWNQSIEELLEDLKS
ncbi:MAG: hypothetical protein AAGG68_00305 [Bacteroidota bacterium]